MKNTLLLIILLPFLLIKTTYSQSYDTDDLDMSQLIQPVDSTHFFAVDDYYVWDNCIIRDSVTGEYSLFYAMWPKAIGYSSWLTHSAIYRAVSANACGPYVGIERVLGAAGAGAWDELSVFNVKVNRFDDKYCLYYCASNSSNIDGGISDSALVVVGSQGFGNPYWMPIRNSQRTGMAVSASLDGPWERPQRPFMEPAVGVMKNIVNNPSVTRMPGGGYLLMVKGDHPSEGHGKMIQVVGLGDSAGGPFEVVEKPAFDDISTEDATVWYDNKRGRYYAIFHAAGQDFLGLITSVDGVSWGKARNYFVCRKEIPLKDGTVMQIERMERPSVYLEAGKPAIFSVAVKNGNDSFICFFELKR